MKSIQNKLKLCLELLCIVQFPSPHISDTLLEMSVAIRNELRTVGMKPCQDQEVPSYLE